MDVVRWERNGGYLGKCVQIIPHVTDEIRERVDMVAGAGKLEALVVECGGTIGNIESLSFLEALRQMRVSEPGRTAFVHVTLAPTLDVVGEQKTKPTQHGVQELRRMGIQPDYLAVRCSTPLLEESRQKISHFTGVPVQDVLSCHDVDSIFMVPRILYMQGMVDSIFRKFGMAGLIDSSAR